MKNKFFNDTKRLPIRIGKKQTEPPRERITLHIAKNSRRELRIAKRERTTLHIAKIGDFA